jgi:hypothetical protein
VFYCENDTKTAKSFIDTMKQCFQQIDFEVAPPREFAIKTNRFPEWRDVLKANLNPSVQCVVCLLPGQKGKAPLYDDIKSLLMKDIPVPS